MRLALISIIKRAVRVRIILESTEVERVLVFGGGVKDLYGYHGVLLEEGARLDFYCTSKSHGERKRYADHVQRFIGNAEISRKDNYNLDESKFRRMLKAFLSSGLRQVLPKDMSKRCLFITRWDLKTVPPAIAPVINKLKDDFSVTIINCGAEVSKSSILKSVYANQSKLNKVGVLSYRSQYQERPSTEVAKYIMPMLWNQLYSHKELVSNGLDLRFSLDLSLNAFCRSGLWKMVAFDHDIATYLQRPNSVVVGVCPGRHTEALIAQDAARYCGKKSIDVQNAYMTEGYTYTRPYGDLIAAIDSWSCESIVNHFGADSRTVKNTGTPRFDSLASELEKIDVNGFELPFKDLGNKLLTFASQPVGMEKNLEITRLLAQSKVDDLVFNILIKLHPRDTNETLDLYIKYVASLKSRHDIVVSRDIDVYKVVYLSDVLVTMFSNVGVEAAIMGKNVLIANLGGENCPLPLDEFNIGCNAYTDEEFHEGLVGLITCQEFREKIFLTRAKYFADNPHFINGNAIDNVVSLFKGSAG